MEYLLGIDLGTSSVRAALVGADGRVAGIAGREYPIQTPHPDWAEQDPETWWQASVAAIRRVVAQTGLPAAAIRAVGLSGQMHGLVLLDREGRPLRPAIIWPDKRSQAQCREIAARMKPEQLYGITGMPTATGLFGVSLLWVKEHEPQLYQRIHTAFLPKDFIRYRLTREIATDVTDGSGTLLFDVTRRHWSGPIVDALELKTGYLPAPLESVSLAGRLTAEAAAATGLAAGTPVSAGGGDQLMGAIGAGITAAGVVASTIGTGGQVFTAAGQPRFDPGRRIHTLCHALPDRWFLMGAILAAGLSLRWFKENLCQPEDRDGAGAGTGSYELLSQAAATVEPGAQGLLFLPYLCGERTPHMDPNAKGCFIGLSLAHRQAHLVRAVMEGVAFAMKDSLAVFAELGIPVRTIVASGGAARSEVWSQIQADVYETPVTILSNREHSVYGAALLAGVTSGIFGAADLQRLDRPVERRIAPDPDHAAIYRKHYTIYRSLYPSLKAVFEQLA
jgi:xylulokinase